MQTELEIKSDYFIRISWVANDAIASEGNHFAVAAVSGTFSVGTPHTLVSALVHCRLPGLDWGCL